MMSVEMKKVWEVAKKVDDLLRADDERFSRSAEVIHEDGSVMILENAFVEEYKDWYIVFSEHFGFHVFHKEDVYRVSQHERIEIGVMKP